MSARTGTRLHPKVEARRAAVAKSRARWRTHLVVLVTALFSLFGGGWLAVQSSLLDLEEVKVMGTHRADPADIRSAADVERGEPLLLVGRGAVADRVERLPWVERAQVSWSLPGTLVVRIDERTPVGWIAVREPSEPRTRTEGQADASETGASAADTVALVDVEGRVLDIRTRAPARLMELEYPGAVPDPGHHLENAESVLAIAAAVPDTLRGRVMAVRRAATGFVLDVDGVEIVRFGAAEAITQKWSALEAVLDELGERSVYLIDIRVPSVPSVRVEERLPEPEQPETPADAVPADGSAEPEPEDGSAG